MEMKIEGLVECQDALKKFILDTPVAAKTGLRKAANEMRKTARRRTPDSGVQHKAKLKKKYGVKIIDEGLNMKAMVYNSAPHFHLVEQGHVLIIRGKNCGFVEGKHFFEQTVDEYEDKFPKIIEEMVEKEVEEWER